MVKQGNLVKGHVSLYVFLIVLLVVVVVVVLAAGGRKSPPPQCNDHIDNDGNGYCDYKSGGSYCTNGAVRLGDPGCSSKSDTTEASSAPSAVCGNNIVESSEVCDGNTRSCTTTSLYLGTQKCNALCNGWDFNCTSTLYCGDGMKNGAEQCDGTDLGGQTCASQGFASGTLLCDGWCRLSTVLCSASCTPNWLCTEWAVCSVNGTQTRTCTDQNNCGTTTGKPEETQSCIYVGPPPLGNQTNQTNSTG